MQNIELKARLPQLTQARKIARGLATGYIGKLHQRDTYFHVQDGLLKLRHMPGQPDELIFYRRPKRRTAKSCDYTIYPTDNARLLHTLLSDALGVRILVEKTREVFLYRTVRIHLDRVKKLGTFLEFEAVLRSRSDAPEGQRLVEYLTEEFGITQKQLVPVSYGLLLEQQQSGG